MKTPIHPSILGHETITVFARCGLGTYLLKLRHLFFFFALLAPVLVCAQEIDVLGNGISIADDDMTPSFDDHTDFGAVLASSGTIVRSFTIANTPSTVDLQLTGGPPFVTIGGSDPTDFVVTLVPTDLIVPNSSTTFEVTFDPTSAGAKSATISIGSNDANENPYDFTVAGYGLADPNLNVGDIAFTMYNSDGDKEFAFVALAPIGVGQEIHFMDHGWDDASSAILGNNEGAVTFTTSAALNTGDQVIVSPMGGTPSATLYNAANPGGIPTGSVVNNVDGGFDPDTDGDQLLAFEGAVIGANNIAVSQFLTGIHASNDGNGANGWTTTPTGTDDSNLPSALSNEVNAVSLFPSGGEDDNAVYTGPVDLSVSALRSAINTPGNWDSNGGPGYGLANLSTLNINNVPAVVAPLAPMVTEDDTDVDLSDDIAVSDPDGELQTLSFTITGGVLNFVSSIGVTFDPVDGNGTNNFSASGTLLDLNNALNTVTFTPDADLSGTDVATIAFTSNDGKETSATASVTFSITPVNDAPSVTGLGGDAFNYVEDAGPELLDVASDATLSDVDNPSDLSGGNLTVTLFDGEDNAEDQLSINTTGSIVLTGTTAGSEVRLGPDLIGTLQNNVAPGADLIVNLSGAGATLGNVQALIRNVTYENTDINSPTTGTRTIRFTVDDGDGLNSTSANYDVFVTVEAANDPPTISNLGGDSYTYQEGDGATIIDQSQDAAVQDVDNPMNFAGGNLTVTISDGEDAAEDQLSISTLGAISLSGTTTGSTVGIGLDVFGTIQSTVAPGVDLVVSLSGVHATPANVATLIRNITYQNINEDDPTVGDRTIRFTLDDGAGGSSTSPNYEVIVTIEGVNDAPVVDLTGADPGVDTTTVFEEDLGAIAVASSATIVDDDAPADLINGQLLVTWNAGLAALEDELSIAEVGSITLSGTEVSYSGGKIGDIDMTNDGLGTNLEVDFNTSNATLQAVQALLRAIRYNNTSNAPSTTARVLEITVDDGQPLNSTSAPTTSTISITPANDLPTLTGLPVLITVEEDIAGNVDFSSVALGDEDGEDITVTLFIDGFGTFSTPVDVGSVTEMLVDPQTITLQGSPANITAYFDVPSRIQYTSDQDFNGSAGDINVSVADATTTVDFGDVPIDVTAVDDAPELSATAEDPLYASGLGEVDLFNSASASTVEGGQRFTAFTVTVDGVFDGADEGLSVNGVLISLDGGETNASAGSLTYNSSFLSNTTTLDFTGSLTAVQFESVINNMRYSNSLLSPTTGFRDVTIISITDDGLDTSPNVNTASISVTSRVNVVAKDNDSRLERTGGEQTVKIPYNTYRGEVGVDFESNSITVLTFSVTDLGTNDPLPTVIDQITVAITSDKNDIDDIIGIGVFSGSSLIGATNTISASTDIPLPGTISVDDMTSGTFDVKVSFSSVVTDNNQFTFDITGAQVPAGGSSTLGLINATSQTMGDRNTIEVDATGLFFVQLDTTVVPDENFMITLQAQDVNGNVDVDEISSVNLSKSNTSGNVGAFTSVGGNVPQVMTAGEVVFDDLRVAEIGDFTITATASGLASATSVEMSSSLALTDVIVDADFVFDRDIDYADPAYQITNFTSVNDGLQVAQFIIREGGADPRLDGKPTEIDGQCGNDPICSDSENGFEIEVSSGGDNIRQLALYVVEGIPGIPDGTIVGQYSNTPGDGDNTYVFNFDDDNGSFGDTNHFRIPDGDRAKVGVFVSFQDEVNDREQIVIKVKSVFITAANQSLLANPNGAPFGTTDDPQIFPSLVDGENVIEVTATTLAFNPDLTPDPSDVLVVERATGFDVTVEARDDNGNVDVDETSAFNLALSTGDIESPAGPYQLSAGTVTIPSIVADTANIGELSLTASDIDATGSKNGIITLSSALTDRIDIQDTAFPGFVTLSPFDTETDVSIGTDLVMTFSETILPDIGNIVIVKNDVPPISDEIAATSPQVQYNGNQVTITPTEVLDESSNYYVFIEGDAFQDPGGNNFAGFQLEDDWVFVSEVIVTMLSATPIGDSGLKLLFNTDVQINDEDLADFTLVDGVGNDLSSLITGLTNDVPNDEELELVVDLSTAIGDLTLTYTGGGTTEISNTLDISKVLGTTVLNIDFDDVAPEIFSAAANGLDKIDVIFTDAVGDNGASPADFTLKDGLDIEFEVTAIGPGIVPNDEVLELTVGAGFSAAVGDLVLTYEQSTGTIDDFGENSLADNTTGVIIDLDTEAPTLFAATVIDETTLQLEFDDEVRILSGDPPGDFKVRDGFLNPYAVSAITDNGGGDRLLRLTIQTIENAIGDIQVTYEKTGSEIQDFGSNTLATNTTGFTIDYDPDPPTITGVADVNGASMTVIFSEEVFIANFDADDFIVTDGLNNEYRAISISDATPDNLLTITVNYTSAIGDITLTYDDDNDTGDILDYGSNFLLDEGTGIAIDFDTTDPSIASAVEFSDTRIDVTFDDVVQNLSETPSAFTVTDGIGQTYEVTDIAETVPASTVLQLTVNSLTDAIGDLTVTYTSGAGSIRDFGGNTLQDDGTGVVVESDNTPPTVTSATVLSPTSMELKFTDVVQLVDGDPSNDFRVVDGLLQAYTVNAISDNIPGDSLLRLVIQSTVDAVGDLTVSYTNSSTEVRDFGSNVLGNFSGVVAENDSDSPELASASTVMGNTSLTLVMNEPVDLQVNDPADFVVTDGFGDDYLVTGIDEGTPNDEELTLTVNYGAAVGDLTITYNYDGDDIADFGGNFLQDNSIGISIDFDTTDPEMVSAVEFSDTRIDVTFNDVVQDLGETPSAFTVTDGIGQTYDVTGIAETVPGSTVLQLTVDALTDAIGDLTVTYASGAGSIGDYGGNTLQDDATGVVVESDNTRPTVTSATVVSPTLIELKFTDVVQVVDGDPSNDFRVLDGLLQSYAVNVISDNIPEDSLLRLVVQSTADAVGDLTVSYTNTSTDVQDFGGNVLDNFAGIVAENDGDSPELVSASTVMGNTSLTLVMNEPVDLQVNDPADFVVTDGFGDDYLVTGIDEGTPDDEELTLTVNYGAAVGDLTITYNYDGDDIADFGGNFLQDNSIGISIDFDTTDPEMVSAVEFSDTRIDVTFNDVVQDLGETPSAFTVTDGIGQTYDVTGIAETVPGSTVLQLTVDALTDAIGDLTVTYASGAGSIGDYGGNTLQDDATGVVVESDNTRPTVTSATVVSPTLIELKFTDVVQVVDGDPSNDFRVLDGLLQSYAVNVISDNIPEDSLLRLVVQSTADAVGDLTVSYTNTSTDVQDFGGNVLDNFAGIVAENDGDSPELVSASTVMGNTSLTLVLNEPVDLQVNDPADFVVTDGFGDDYLVTGIDEGTPDDEELTLTVNYGAAVGDLTITYNYDGDDIADFGGNFLQDNSIGISIDFDTTDPEMVSAVEFSDTRIDVTFNDVVQDLGETPSAFAVTDGIGQTFDVTNIAATVPGSQVLQLTVNSLATAVGDLRVTYTSGAGSIGDYGGNTLQDDATGVVVESDGDAPSMVSATSMTATTIDITFDDFMQVVNAAPAGDFQVRDGSGAAYVVSSIIDNAPNDFEIRLLVQSIADAKGDIFIDYASTGSVVSDFGGNPLSAPPIPLRYDRDTVDPEMASVTATSESQIEVSFNDAVQIIGNQPSDFVVRDAQNTTFAVTGLSDGAPADAVLVLEVEDFTNSVGDLTVTYTGALGEIRDFGGNVLAADPSGETIERDLRVLPLLTENPTGVNGDDDDDVALYRTTGDPRGRQPIVVTPNVDGSTIRIYSDEALTSPIVTQPNVPRATGFQPPLSALLPSIIWDDATDDHGVFTVYITEIAVDGASAEGPAVDYSIALLDELSFSTDAKTFRAADDVGVTISLNDHPATDQELLFLGNGLADITYNPGGTSTARFVPVAAGNDTHDMDITWENTATNVSATFRAVESFLVSENVPLFEAGQSLTFCKTDGVTPLQVNSSPPNIDVDGAVNDDGDQDFYALEVYFIENGSIKTDIPGDMAGILSADGNIANIVLQYDADNTVPDITPGVPTFTTGEWAVDPSAFTQLGVSLYEIDTLLFSYVISSDDGSVLTFLSEETILLFPEPTVTITNLEDYYCEDEGPVQIEARIFTFDGGIDTTGVITTGYRMWYSPDDPTFASRTEYDFTRPATLSNIWRPRDPNQNGDSDEDESGYYRIFYQSVPQTSAGCDAIGFVDLEVISTADEPTISSDLSGIGGQDMSGAYTLEFCEGETLPTITASGLSLRWLGPNRTTVVKEGADLDILNDVFGGNQPGGGASVQLFIQDRNILDQAGAVITDPGFQGCSSGQVEVNIRIRAIPPAPEAEIAQTGDASFNEEDLSTSAGRSYLYEYCAGEDVAGIDLSQRGVNINNISDSRAHFLLIPEDFDYAQAVDFDANFVDWSTDIFGGGVAKDTIIHIALVTNNGIFAGGGPDAFAGCTSETSTFELRISTAVVPDILTSEGSDFTTEYFTCFGDPINTIDIENGTYNWYTDDALTSGGQLTYSETDDDFLVQALDLTNNALLGSNTAYQPSSGGAFSVNEYDLDDEAGIYYYWVRGIDNASDDSNFPGCESTPTLISLTVFDEPLEPVFNGSSVVNENDDNVDFELFFCASDLDESVTFNASLNGFMDTAFSTDATDDGSNAAQVTHDFVWYNSNDDGDQLAFAASGAVVNAVDLGLISSNDIERFIYLEQVENIVIDQNGSRIADGCASDGVVIRFTIFREPDAPETDATAYYYCDGEPIDDLLLEGEPDATFTWIVDGSPMVLTNDADGAGLVSASMDDLGIGQSPDPDSTYLIKVVQQTDAVSGSLVPPVSDPFVGCSSDTTEIQIFVRSIPEPVTITTPQVCADGQLVEVRFSGDQRANSFFVYPTDDRQASLRQDTLGGNAEQLSFDLLGAEAGRDTIIYISQITDTDLNPDFVGCESALTPIPVFAKPILGDFGGNNGLINDPKACSEVVELEIQITNQGTDVFADYTFSWSANNAVRSEPTQAGGTSPLLGGEIYSITMDESFVSATLPVSVTVTDKDGCVSEASRSIPIGQTPDPQFRVSNITAGNNTTFSFDDFEIIDDNEIQSFRFEIIGNGLNLPVEERLQDPDILTDYEEDGFVPGEYTATLTLISVSGCENIKTRSFEVIGREVVPESGLVHDFNAAGANGWISEALNGFEDRVEVWEAAVPSASNPNINEDPVGQRSSLWITNADGNYSGEVFDYFVYSPTFDFSALTSPAVSFDYYEDLVGASDGVVFQWSVDDGATWNNLGAIGSGEDWFDAEGIAGNPGTVDTNPRQLGWAGSQVTNEGWQRGVHSLTDPGLGDFSNVRFRFALGVRPGNESDKSEGFAFDNFSIFNRNRLTVLETFSSSISEQSRSSNDEVYETLQTQGLQNDIIWVNYFTDLADDAAQRDLISTANRSDPEARLAFYGVSDTPSAVLSGEVKTPRPQSIGDLGFDENDLQRSILADTQFDVEVSAEEEEASGLLQIRVNVVANPENENSFDVTSETSIRVLILQDEVSSDFIDNVEGPYTFRNRLIKILPAADGELVKGVLTDGQVLFNETIEWEIKDLFGEEGTEVGLTVVAFVQDEIGRGVYQVGVSRLSVVIPETVTGVLPDLAKQETYDVYPNPGDKQFTIRMPNPVRDRLGWTLADYAGKEVMAGELRRGATETVINIEELASGVYLLKLSDASSTWQSRRVMVLRRE